MAFLFSIIFTILCAEIYTEELLYRGSTLKEGHWKKPVAESCLPGANGAEASLKRVKTLDCKAFLSPFLSFLFVIASDAFEEIFPLTFFFFFFTHSTT